MNVVETAGVRGLVRHEWCGYDLGVPPIWGAQRRAPENRHGREPRACVFSLPQKADVSYGLKTRRYMRQSDKTARLRRRPLHG